MDKAGAEADLELLLAGPVEVVGLLPYSSNYTYLARVGHRKRRTLAVYKPMSGERPLWDFPYGTLGAREVAAYELSEASGWRVVPPTVMRDDAPLGAGTLQLFIEHDPDRHYFVLMEERPDDFAVFAAFDIVINNADRKAGHIIEGPDGKLWGVDHGLCFHAEPKLRTVIWTLADSPLSPQLRWDLEHLGERLSDGRGLGRRLAHLLTPEEAAATLERVEALLIDGCFPRPGDSRPLPWPLI
jgi:hypothetical protein